MASNETWNGPTFEAAAAALTPMPAPTLSRSPLMQEVVDLAARVSGVDDPDPTAAVDCLDRSWFDGISLVLVDAVLARDKRALDLLDATLRDAHRLLAIAEQELTPTADAGGGLEAVRRSEGWLQLTMEFVRAALGRVAPVAVAVEVAGTHRERFLRIVAEHPAINSRQIGELIAAEQIGQESTSRSKRPLDEGQLSKIAKKLRSDGLVFAERSRSGLAWELTPRGRLVVDRLLGAPEDPDHPVNSMVIATGRSPAAVAATLSANEPREVKVLRDEESITYERRAPSVERSAAEPDPVTLVAAVTGFMAVAEVSPPPVFQLENGVVYEQVEQLATA